MKKLYIHLFLITLTVAGLLPRMSFGHARFTLNGATPPRTADLGLKSSPCGNKMRTVTPTVLKAGQTVELSWEETIDHPGYYRIAFSPANDLGFDQNVLVLKVDDLPNVHNYKATITVPNTPCTGCTLQMIQYMTESNPPSLYFSCADINIIPATAPMPSATPKPSFTPVPTPTCH